MAACTPQGANLLYGLRKGKAKLFDNGLAAKLPPAYLKFYKEWRETKPTAVHYIPKDGQFERDEITGLVNPIQNIPLPIVYPPEHHHGIWGGEGVVKGFVKRAPTKRRVPKFWIPTLRRSIVHSVVLNQYMSVIVTDRTINLIHDNHGFDHYLLKTLACDLKSTLALGIKRKILQSLKNGCPAYSDDPIKQKDILEEYAKYAEAYTTEELEWYGLTYHEAIKKISQILKAQEIIQPQKIEFRSKLIQQLREAGIAEAQTGVAADSSELPTSSSWLSKMNPFGKKKET